MAYMSAAAAAVIRADLAAAFPKSEGWKFSVRKDSLSVNVTILAAPFPLESWEWDSYGRVTTLAGEAYDDMPRSAGEAAQRDRRRVMTSEDVNHFWIDSNHPKATAEALTKILAIIRKLHWDKSDIQSDYFHCAFYIHLTVGKWDAPCVYPAAKVAENA